MPIETQNLSYRQVIPVGPAEIYRAFTSSTALREWLCDSATVSTRLSGHLFVGWNDGYYATGHYTELDANRIVGFTWQGRGEPRPTSVRVTIEPGDGGTYMALEHCDIGVGPEWGDKLEQFDRAWRRALENLASVLTSGEDLRVTRRPMLGVLLMPFDADEAVRLGVPVEHGVRLGGVVPGQGAEAAGLRQDDIIVAVAGHATTDVTELRNALQSHHAGDVVMVEFYRGDERLSAAMTLSGRKIPVIPATNEELAERVRQRLTRDEAALDEFLAEVTDVEASYRPGPEAWSIKQVMAHLIQSERYNQQWIDELVASQEASYDAWSGNQEMRLNATIHAFPTLADMLVELKRLNEETVALLQGLPDEFVARKRTYWRLARTLLDESYSHIDDHMTQMKTALAAARAA